MFTKQIDTGVVVQRYARLGALLVLGCFAAFSTWVILNGAVGPPGQDIDNYWNAALRLRAGESLYINAGDPNSWYPYAPWLAWLWVPLTYVPRPLIALLWSVACLGGWGYTMWRSRSAPALLLLVGPLLLYGAWVGNVQPLMIAALLRWRAPLTVGILASIKGAPIMFVLLWAGRRDWRRFGLAIAAAGLLIAPVLLYPLDSYPFGLGPGIGLWGLSPVVGIASSVVAAVVAVAAAQTRYTWLAAAVAVIAARPHLLPYDTAYLLIAIPDTNGE